MGKEAVCQARHGRESGEGLALLETDELVFRGDFRVRVPLRDIASVNAEDGRLTVVWPGGRLVLDQEITAGELVSFLLYAVTVAAAIT